MIGSLAFLASQFASTHMSTINQGGNNNNNVMTSEPSTQGLSELIHQPTPSLMKE